MLRAALGGATSGIMLVLFIVFACLQLADVIAWSWWAVTAPLWIGAILGAVAWVAAKSGTAPK